MAAISLKRAELCAFVIASGVWLFALPETFGYLSSLFIWNDRIAGILLILLGLFSLKTTHRFLLWAIAGTGLWLQLSPLLFWAPLPVIYVNDTLVGIIAIVFAFQLSGISHWGSHDSSLTPPGWSYNPSSWFQRTCTVALAFLCWFLARYLAAYQLGYIDEVYDPFFGEGTRKVLTSKVSKLFPISDAGLGAFGYTMEAIMGWQGDKRRWCTMPWLVLTFGVFVVPVSVVSILLIILQPVAVGAWCGFCLVTALAMLIMIILTMAEVIATLQFLVAERRKGKPFWRLFWKGEEPKTGVEAKPKEKRFAEMAMGITMPWNLLLSMALGIWLMCSPSFFGTQGGVANSDYVVGPLLIAISMISFAEVVRAGRFLNILLGIWLLMAPSLLSNGAPGAEWNNYLVGAAIIALTFPRGAIKERYGSWDKCIF